MKRRLLLFFLLVSSLVAAQNNIYRSGGITQTVGAPTFVPGASGNIVAIDTVTGEWYVNPNRLSGSSWISAGYRLTNISGSVPPAYTPTAHQSHLVINAANQMYYWDGAAWQDISSTDATRLKFLVVNKSGGALNKGDVVYVSGAQGNRVAVKKALATADSLSANTLGVVDQTIANNNEGYCVAEGLVTGLNTSAFTEGAALYLSPTTAGAITQTKPTAPNHLVLIGYCVKSNNGSGEVSVHIDNGYELGELHDVYIPAPTNGQVLTYDATDSRWEAATVADQSATNEIQRLDTFSLSGQALSASLLNDGVAASSVTLPIVDVVAGTNVTVNKSNGVATINALASQLSGVTGYVSQFNSSTTIDTTGIFWNGRLGIGTASPAARFHTVGSGNTSGSWTAQFHNSTGNNNALMVRDDGNVGVGTSSPGARLQVNGSGGTPFAVQSSTNNNIFRVNENASVNLNLIISNSGLLELYGRENLDRSITLRANAASTLTSGEKSHVYILDGFSPTSGTANYRALTVAPTINQSGGANGESIGLLIQPDLTSAANWKSLQWNNNSGWGIYGNGTAKSYFAGNVAIGTTTQNASAAFEVSSTTQGILFPRMTTTQRDAITTPANGLVIYNTTTDKLQVRAAGAWVDLH